jgi:hypothetical protein
MAIPFLNDIDLLNVSRVINVPNPTSATDVVPRGYVDSLIEGLSWKDNVVVSTQGNINLASPGATIDGVTMVAGDRVLVRLQTTPSQNGIYTWNASGSAMTRTLDANTFLELTQAVVIVNSGTSAGTSWRQTQVGGTIDTNDVTFVTFLSTAPSASETTAGLIEIATQAETDAGTFDGGAVTPLKLASWSLRPRRFAADVGDGSATQYTITHNLNSRDVQHVLYNRTTWDRVMVDVAHTTVNSVTVTFKVAPTANQYRIFLFA